MRRETDDIYRLIKDQWPYLIVLSVLSALVLWVLIPGNIKRSVSSALSGQLILEEEALKSKKQALLNELKLLDEALAADNCQGEGLDNINNLLPPRVSTDPKINDLVKRLDESVVLVLVFPENENTEGGDASEFGFGSGFFIGESLILTNAHVVGDLASGNSVMVGNKRIGVTSAKVVHSTGKNDSLEDFAVLKIAGQIGKELSFFDDNSDSSHKLKKVYAAGYPYILLETDGNFLEFMEGDMFSFPDLNITNGQISSEQSFRNKIETLVHDAKISPGNSGGPLTDECGNVLGINTFYYGDNEAINFFSIRTSEILGFLKKNNIEYATKNTICGVD